MVQNKTPRPATAEQTATDRVTAFLADRIINGTYRPGQPLSEMSVVHSVGASRTPVREALRRLERDGLVRMSAHGGAYVADFSDGDVREIYLCRENLEGLAARLAAENMTAEALAKLRALVNEMARAAGKRDRTEFFRVNVAFGRVKLATGGNEVLNGLIESLGLRVLRLRHLSMGLPGRMEASLALHRALVDAFARHDKAAAERINRELIGGACKAILDYHFGMADDLDRAYLREVATTGVMRRSLQEGAE
jgi:DNA-binding GntR family transcriptional regulator